MRKYLGLVCCLTHNSIDFPHVILVLLLPLTDQYIFSMCHLGSGTHKPVQTLHMPS